jgi:asparagine synthase (glutamine-hydrolysing)
LGAVTGVYGRPESATRDVQNMLVALRHRGTNTKVRDIEDENAGWAIGCASIDDLEKHFIESAKCTISFDGSFFQRQNPVRFVHKCLASRTTRGAVHELMSEPGEYAALGLIRGKMFAFRDPNGLKPLYYGECLRVTAFASERKALWRIGFRDVKRVLPGQLVSVDERGIRSTSLVQTVRTSERSMTFDAARLRLTRFLRRSVRRITRTIDRVAVAFSGGLDSAVTAVLAKNECEVELVSVGLAGSAEISTVEKYAREIDLPVRITEFDPNSLEEYVRRVIWLIEEPNLMKVSVAVPIHWAAQEAARRGFTVMLCGQGSDELFGGYYKYARILDADGRRALVEALDQSVIDSAQVNYERDEQATAPFGVELRTPYADLDLIRFSLTIPSEYKVRPHNDLIRKWILRSVAADLGLPSDIAGRRKKAIQHGTGVESAIRKIAKTRNMTVESYLAGIHTEVKDLPTMP